MKNSCGPHTLVPMAETAQKVIFEVKNSDNTCNSKFNF